MYSLRFRLLYGIFALVLGTFLLWRGVVWGWVPLTIPVLLTWGYVRYGPMVLAFKAYHDRDWPALEQHLATVRRPAWLSAQNRAYFALLSGVVRYKRGDVPGARALLAAVPEDQLRTDNMRSILECHRAELALAAGDRAAAEEHVRRARAIPHKPEIDDALMELMRQLAAV